MLDGAQAEFDGCRRKRLQNLPGDELVKAPSGQPAAHFIGRLKARPRAAVATMADRLITDVHLAATAPAGHQTGQQRRAAARRALRCRAPLVFPQLSLIGQILVPSDVGWDAVVQQNGPFPRYALPAALGHPTRDVDMGLGLAASPRVGAGVERMV